MLTYHVIKEVRWWKNNREGLEMRLGLRKTLVVFMQEGGTIRIQ